MNYELRIPFTHIESHDDPYGGTVTVRSEGPLFLVKKHLNPDWATHLITAGPLATIEISVGNEGTQFLELVQVIFDGHGETVPILLYTEEVNLDSPLTRVREWAAAYGYEVKDADTLQEQ